MRLWRAGIEITNHIEINYDQDAYLKSDSRQPALFQSSGAVS